MSNKVKIHVHNLELTEKMSEYITKKASNLDRYLGDLKEVRIDLSNVKSARNANDRMVSQITARARRALLRTEERSDDLMAAFDNAIDKMQRQIERYKGRRRHGRGDGRSAADVATAVPSEREETFVPAIARRKKIKITPMKEADALEQMRMLGHDNFFIFFDIETESISVLYKRRDGTYGVIETK